MTDPAKKQPNRDQLTRRTLLRYGGSLGAAAAGMSSAGGLLRAANAYAKPLRVPDSLPNPKLPAGAVDEALPFDHIVVVMMENHSFDNLLGALRRTRPAEGRRPALRDAGAGAQQQPRAAKAPVVTRSRSPTTAPGAERHADLERDPRADRRRRDGRVRALGRAPREPMGY